MRGFGILLVVVGFGSLVLPYLNLQFTLLEPVDAYQPFAGLIVGVIGIGLIAAAQMRARGDADASAQGTAAAADRSRRGRRTDGRAGTHGRVRADGGVRAHGWAVDG
jgi:hypothetical protein